MPRSHRVPRLRALAVGSTSLALAAVLSLSSAHAEPQVSRADVERAFHAAEAANEEVNQLTQDQQTLTKRIEELSAELATVQQRYEEQRAELEAAIVQQHLDAPLGPTVNLIASKDAQVFLDGLSAVDALNTSRAEALDSFGDTSRQLQNRKAKLDQHRAKLEAAVAEAKQKQAEVQAHYEKAQADLQRLESSQRAELTAPGNTQVPAGIPPASGNAQAAINFALAQLGDPYVYGGTGPDGWDCSGLTQAAWAAAGVSLPRVVGPQINAGTRIPMSELQPGDLVAYSSMSHIGMYLGNGQVIHAPRPGKTVEIVGLSGFSVASRVG